MYAVIFRATVRAFDEDYATVAASLRERALSHYGCREFTACTEGDSEIAISYWDDLGQITAWKADAEHLLAQQRGRDAWYRSYSVEVVEITRQYRWPMV